MFHVGRFVFAESLTFLWVVVGVFAILMARMFFISRYYVAMEFGGIRIVLATMGILFPAGLFVLFGVPQLATVMDTMPRTSIVLFLVTLLGSAGVSGYVFIKVRKPLENWAARKVYESIEAELREESSPVREKES